jgi:uncharacterized damage-inducible protein DinB
VAALTSATSQVMDADAGIGTVREALAVLQFHEAYHAGQVGLLRRLLGKPGVIKPPQQPPRRQSALA